MTDFEVRVKMTIVALQVKVLKKLESLELEFPSESYEFFLWTAINQIWITAADQPFQVCLQMAKRQN